MKEGWSDEIPVGIVICDSGGTIEWMNNRAARIFKGSGGMELVGGNLSNCHPERAQDKLREIFDKKEPNGYTVENNGSTVMLYQAPRFVGGEFKGFVEFIFTVPADIRRLDQVEWVEK